MVDDPRDGQMAPGQQRRVPSDFLGPMVVTVVVYSKRSRVDT